MSFPALECVLERVDDPGDRARLRACSRELRDRVPRPELDGPGVMVEIVRACFRPGVDVWARAQAWAAREDLLRRLRAFEFTTKKVDVDNSDVSRRATFREQVADDVGACLACGSNAATLGFEFLDLQSLPSSAVFVRTEPWLCVDVVSPFERGPVDVAQVLRAREWVLRALRLPRDYEFVSRSPVGPYNAHLLSVFATP